MRTQVLRDLQDNPNGPRLNPVEAAAALGISPARLAELVFGNELQAQIENGRVVGVERASVMRQLDERTRDRSLRP